MLTGMNRRKFLTALGSTGALPLVAQNYSDYSKDPRPDVAEGTYTAGSATGPVFSGSPVVMGPASDALTILQPLRQHATGYLEYAVEDGPLQRVDAGHAGLLPFAEHVLKFRLPPLPSGKSIRYRFQARTAGWVKVRQFYHGELKAGPWQISPEYRFRTLSPAADTTTFAVWNDTHENAETIKAVHGLTVPLKPDFLLWNGDQSNDVHFPRDMAGQFLTPAGLPLTDWPLAYVRGNHDLRGPAAHSLTGFTGTPGDRYYYAFRSGPLAALVMDTGEDKADSHEAFGGMAAFEPMQRQQAQWIQEVTREPWFREAPFKVLFCHLPLWWLNDNATPKGPWSYTRFCRNLWAPHLEAAGVKLVVSGHTHNAQSLPPKPGQPLHQVTGGGPTPKAASFMIGTVTRDTLTLKVNRLDGTEVANVVLKA
jgi:hypothetical protein